MCIWYYYYSIIYFIKNHFNLSRSSADYIKKIFGFEKWNINDIYIYFLVFFS